MFFSKNKKHNLRVSIATLLPFFMGLLFFVPLFAHAGIGDEIETAIIKTPLYMIFTAVGWFTSIAVTIFGWAVNPDYISGPSGILNGSSIYAMWKLVRDFLNLFFILTLLYTAFTIVFQVAKDYKKTLLSLVLAALFVNFSFPITRFIIDVTNVPMYYFINQIGTSNAGADKLGTVLSAVQLKNILIPGSAGDDTASLSLATVQTSQLLMAIIFLFIFSVTILVLAILFVVRVVALIILLVFASVGFAASVMPGLSKYSSMWWDKLWQYTLFGPAAALMLFIATRFFAEIAENKTPDQFLQSAIAATPSQFSQFISAMAMFSVPIIMLWMAIGLASSMSIAGAGAISGRGEKFIKWAGRKATYNNPLGRGVGGGLKKAAMDGKLLGFDYGKRAKMLTGNYWAAPSKVEAGIKGFTAGGAKGAKTELQKLKDKQIHEQIAKDKENKLSRTDAVNRLGSSDDVMRIAAATSLANMDNGIQSMDDLTKALTALKAIDPATGKRTLDDPNYSEKALEIIAKTDKKIIAKTTDPAGVTTSGLQNLQSVISSLGGNQKAINDLVAKVEYTALDGTANDYQAVHDLLKSVKPGMEAALESKAKKEGKTDAMLEFKFNTRINPADTRASIALDTLKGMKTEDVAKQEMFKAGSANKVYADAYLNSLKTGGANENIPRYQKIKGDLP